ncbi:hypothetical protein [Paraburkholderia sp. RL17-373-BIF-A]|uniref:hypothetical protein n=1 Tax=Paraburkholderia sp. RL17-373-BIF-A TaxID=3031629 RepID=UPI0038BC5892
MIIKLTLNEATDPDLYAHLAKFDNARLRAGVLKAAAGASVRGERLHAVPTAQDRAAPALPFVTGMPPIPETAMGEQRRRDLVRSSPDLATEPVQQKAPSRELTNGASIDPAVRRWNSDAIGEQFADF